MKLLLGLACFLVVRAQVSQDALIYPDQFERMKLDELKNRGIPPASSSFNDVWHQHQQQQQQPNSFRPTVYDQFLTPKWRDHVSSIISRGITKFTLDLDRAIENSNAARPNNLLFSPVSLTMTMAMVLLASGGKTFEEVAKILGLESGIDITNHSEIVHQIFGLIIQEYEQRVRNNPTEPRSDIAFGMFVDNGFPIREQFRNISEKIYKNEVINVDFSRNGREAKNLINQWVSEKTMNKIKSMLDKEPDPTTRVMILSALYFNGEWDTYFYNGATRRRDFTVENGEVIYADIMYNGGEFMYGEDAQLGLKIVELPYKGKEVAMFVLMPNVSSATALKDLKYRLTPDYIENLIGNMKKSSCIVGLPKMKLSNTLNLRGALQALGLRSLFDPQTADLSILSPGAHENLQRRQQNVPANGAPQHPGYRRYWDANYGTLVEQWDRGFNLRHKRQASRTIDQEFVRYLNTHKLPKFGIDELRNNAGISNPGLYADEVLHKVEMTINERGTEAAAATSVGLNRSGDFKRFITNKPFLFFIRHNPTKIIWFWGTINRPSPYYTTPE